MSSDNLEREIVVQAKRVLLSDEIKDNSGIEILRLVELIERYEEIHGEVEPVLSLYGKKAWYDRLEKKGQVVDLKEIEAIQKL